jgi:hypothetical protein
MCITDFLMTFKISKIEIHEPYKIHPLQILYGYYRDIHNNQSILFMIIKRPFIFSKNMAFPELINYYLSDALSDITLIIDGNKIPSHKFVLCAKSDKFMSMRDLKDSKVSELIIDDASFDSFKIMLKYFYTEKFILEEDNDYLMALEVFKLSKKFQLKRLMDLIEIEMIKLIKIDNFKEIYEFAFENELITLINSWKKFVFENKKVIIEKSLFISEKFDTIEETLKSLSAEQIILIDLLKKVRELNPDSDMKQFESLINLKLCTVDDVNDLRTIGGLFADDLLFDTIVLKYKQLHEHYIEVKQTFEPFLKGYKNVEVNGVEYEKKIPFPDFSQERLRNLFSVKYYSTFQNCVPFQLLILKLNVSYL